MALVTATVLSSAPGVVAATSTSARHAATTAVDSDLLHLLGPRIPGVAEAAGRLYLNGSPRFLTGVNAYSATTDWTVNFGCGSMVPDLNLLFSAMPAGSLVRTWAFQALAFNKFTHKIDFSAIDRVVKAAAAHHDYLILALSDQAGTCDDGHFHNAAWYAGGYKRSYNDDGRGYAMSMSYLRWVKTVVTRYKNNRTVAIYEPVNEPEASNCNAGLTGGSCYGHNTCPTNAAAVLKTFFTAIGRVIRTINPRVLISTGVIGGNQCGVAGRGYATIASSKFVDVTTIHDYSDPSVAASKGLLARIKSAGALGKALLLDEAGILATTSGSGCLTLPQRAADFVAKAKAARKAGADGYVPWNFGLTPAANCSYAIAPDDPTFTALPAS